MLANTGGRVFLHFKNRLECELLNHEIIRNNAYTQWFRKGSFTEEQLRHFIVQFSVFSNQFLFAQLGKVVNADSLAGMRASKEIFANEIGVVFNKGRAEDDETLLSASVDPALVSIEGTVDGGTFRFKAAHFEWLLQIGERLGLSFNDMGKRQHGTASTLFFCDELIRLYGSEDYQVSQAASYAVENWAAAGFWKDLILGLENYNKRTKSDLPIAFFNWHNKIEDQHAQHTQNELGEYLYSHAVDEDAFIKYGNDMLNGVAAFWGGLDGPSRCRTC